MYVDLPVSTAGAAVSLPDRLKAQTAPHHARVEGLLDLMRPDLTLARLRWWVERFYGFLAAWEPRAAAVARGTALAEDVASRAKTHRLVADLRELDLTAKQIAALPLCDALPPLRDVPDLLGQMYVLEGSTLGGAVIARHVERTLGLSGGTGYSYFQSYGLATAARWRSFKQTLVDHSDLIHDHRIIDSACGAFDALHNWLAHGR